MHLNQSQPSCPHLSEQTWHSVFAWFDEVRALSLIQADELDVQSSKAFKDWLMMLVLTDGGGVEVTLLWAADV